MGPNLRDLAIVVIVVIMLGLFLLGVNSHQQLADGVEALGVDIELTGGAGVDVRSLGDGRYEISLSTGNYTETPVWVETSVTARGGNWIETGTTLVTLSGFEAVRVRGDGHDTDISLTRIMGLTPGTAAATIDPNEYAAVITHTDDSADSDGLWLVYLGRDADSLLIGFGSNLINADPHTDILALR